MGRTRQYPWDEYLDGETHILKKGSDYICNYGTFVNLARRAATRDGLQVTVKRIKPIPIPSHGEAEAEAISIRGYRNVDGDIKATNALYPWKDYMDGNTHTLVPGENFLCKAESFISYARQMADKNDLQLKCRSRRDSSGYITSLDISFISRPKVGSQWSEGGRFKDQPTSDLT